MGFFDKLKQGLSKTKNSFEEKMNNVFSTFRKVDEELLEELEEVLIMSDVGVETSTTIINNLRDKIKKNKIEDAERLKEKFMEVTRENAVELEEDCYFLADLRECTVFDTTGKELGRIYDVIQTKNNDVYWIRKPKELLIPVLKDIVLDINIDERKIIIRPVGEWMDED